MEKARGEEGEEEEEEGPHSAVRPTVGSTRPPWQAAGVLWAGA